MKKVLVIGCPGAGKTVFSKKLAAKTGLPLIHLDFYYHDKSKNYYEEKNKPAWFAQVRKLTKGKEWIIDGNYSSTFPERFEAADTIYYFDVPLRTRLWGVFARRWYYRNKMRSDMPVDWREKIDWEFLKFVWRFEKYRPKIENVLDQETSKKVVRFRSRREADMYLENLLIGVK